MDQFIMKRRRRRKVGTGRAQSSLRVIIRILFQKFYQNLFSCRTPPQNPLDVQQELRSWSLKSQEEDANQSLHSPGVGIGLRRRNKDERMIF